MQFIQLEMKEEGETEETGEASLRRASELIKSLISSSYSTKSFSLKWQLLRDKLNHLNSGLGAAHDSGENSAFSDLLNAIVSDANEIQELIDKCSTESCSKSGKLQMNSDLDVAASKLELQIKRLNGIYASGALAPVGALVVSRPGFGARKEETRFYLKDLFSRLMIGSLEMKAQALATLNEILLEDKKNAKIVVVDVPDGIDVLVSLLELENDRVQEEAAEVISVVAGMDAYKGVLVAAGAVSPLIQVVEMGSQLAKKRALRALEKMTENSNNSWSVLAHGGVTLLIKILSEVDQNSELICSACRVLRNLSNVDEVRRFMVEEELVSVLMKVLKSKEEACQIKALEFLQQLASQDGGIKNMVLKDGIVDSLLEILNPNSHSSLKAKEIAIKAIEEFCFSPLNSINGLIRAGFLNRVLFLLKDSEDSAQELALKTVFRLCGTSEEGKKAIGNQGFMPELVKLLDSKCSKVCEMAAETLCSLLSIQRNQRKFIQEDRNIDRVIEILLSTEENLVLNKYLFSVLMSLTDSRNGRKRIAASQYVKNLEKLAENDASGYGKKILRKLAGNSLQSVLDAVWSL